MIGCCKLVRYLVQMGRQSSENDWGKILERRRGHPWPWGLGYCSRKMFEI